MTTAYVTYSYYTDTYLGSDIAEDDFDALALRASAQLDRITYNRAASVTDADDLDAMKMATCAIAEEIQTIAQEGSSGGITSERVGSYSVTYADNNIKQLSAIQRYESVAAPYLENSNGNLLYKGFIAGEYSGTVASE